MKIGIDIDGVLTDEHNYIIDNATKYFYQNNIPYKVHKSIYDSPRLFDVSDEQYILFWKNYFLDYCNNVPTRPYAKEIIDNLKKENNEIIIITARPFTTYENELKEQMQNIAKNWLDKNNIIYDKLIFSENKIEEYRKLNIDVMIEDKPSNITSVAQEFDVICYDHPFNKHIKKENIYRCFSWYDIYKQINELKK